MPITRVNEFQSKPGEERALREVLEKLVPSIRSTAGCRSCVLLSGVDDPGRLLVLEVWDSVDAHKNAAQSIPAADIQRVMPLLGAPPKGQYFE